MVDIQQQIQIGQLQGSKNQSFIPYSHIEASQEIGTQVNHRMSFLKNLGLKELFKLGQSLLV